MERTYFFPSCRIGNWAPHRADASSYVLQINDLK
jgi:hypothetical protein